MSGWDGFAKYCGIQGLLALMVTIAIVVFISIAIIVPKELWVLLGLAWGFYFGKNGTPLLATRLNK